MSGSLKHTTMFSESNYFKDKNESVDIMWSRIKTWKYYENILCQGQDDLNYANLHLCRLNDYIYDKNKSDCNNLLVERGVTDMIYFWIKNTLLTPEEKWVENVVREEYELLRQGSSDNNISEKVLLIQEDIDFIRDVVLKEPTRSKEFPGGLEDYIKNQEKYVKFTKSNNVINNEIIIKDARKYIEQTLGLKFNSNYKTIE